MSPLARLSMLQLTLAIVNQQNAPQNIKGFEQITALKNRILLLESENRQLKDDIANKQKFIQILLNFRESNIQSHFKENILSSLIQKNPNTGSCLSIEQRIENVPSKKMIHLY